MISINLDNVYLNYPIFSSDSRSFKKNVLNKIKSEKFKQNSSNVLHVQALKDINLKINEGDKVGIYGNNGSGKSSLLKVISGIYSPSQGSVAVKGRVNSLISLNAGFNNLRKADDYTLLVIGLLLIPAIFFFAYKGFKLILESIFEK